MGLAAVLDHAEQHREEHLRRLLDYVSRPSISAQGHGIAETADYLVRMLRGMGMEARQVASKGWPFVYARRDDAPGKPRLLIYGHYDVQPADPLEAWHSPPFQPEVRDGRVYGRGVGDNKGQHLANILAVESWLKADGSLPCNVALLLEGEEEVGSPHIADFVRDQRELLGDVDLVVTSDGPVHATGRPTVEFGTRGILSFELRASWANRDVHSGNFGGVVPNPIWTLVHALATMKDAQGRITIDGFLGPVTPPSEAELAAMAALPDETAAVLADLGLQRMDGPASRGFYERLMAWPTLTVNGFHGGYGGEGSKTVLPHEAFAKCDARLVAGQSVAQAEAAIRRHLQRHAPDVSYLPRGGMDPSKTPIDSPWTAPIVRAVRAGTGQEPLLVPAMGGSLPGYVWTQLLGVHAFVLPYANHDEANHAPNENMEVERFFGGIRTGAALLAEIGAAGRPPVVT